jgi:hypothetical protein
MWDLDQKDTSALREQSPPVNGTYISCFDLNKYFSTTGLTNVKFGRQEDISDKNLKSRDEIVLYTKFDIKHRTRWWVQLGPDRRANNNDLKSA